MKRILTAFVLAATLAVYAVMLAWSLPTLSAIAAGNGLVDARMFDMRPAGYDFETSKALLAALGEPGRDWYLSVQQRLDTAFPVLNGLSIFIGLTFVARQFHKANALTTAFAAIPALAAAGFDLAENAAVALMLRAGPNAVTPEMAASASALSIVKSAAVTCSLVLLLAGLAFAGYRYWRKGGGIHGS